MPQATEPDDRIPAHRLLERGDIVQFRSPERYEPRDVLFDVPESERVEDDIYYEAVEFTHGIVVEVLSSFDHHQLSEFDIDESVLDMSQVMAGDWEHAIPNRVSLHLFNDETGRLHISNSDGVPTYSDHHIRELILTRKHSDAGYTTRSLDLADALGLEPIGTDSN